MAPPKKATKQQSDNKHALQKYFDAFASQEGDDETTTVITVSGEDEGDGSGVCYFMDSEGRYYYQPTSNSSNIISLPEATTEDNEGEGEESLQTAEGFQTMALIPTEDGNGELSYVIFVQQPDENEAVADEDNEQTTSKTEVQDVYDFEDNEELGLEEDEEEAEGEKIKPSIKKKPKRSAPSFTCKFCNYVSPRRYLLLRHMKSHSEERPHLCSVCERGFKTVASLQNHVNTHKGVKPYVCRYCNSSFTTSGELVRHIRYKHTHEKPHKCTECDYASVELSKLRRHMRCHTGERPYQCPHCTYASPDTFKLKRHLRTHTGEKPYKCDHCNMRFTQSNSLKAHKLIHSTAKPQFACELCPTTCGRKTDLRIHIQKLHTSEKPLSCKRCSKTFPDRYSYKIHSKTHDGEKCYKCLLCPYASTTLRHLKSHMLKHTDEKPFVCDLCDQSFRQKQLLRRHQNLYHNPFYVPATPKEKTHECRECKRQFAHKGNLIRHLAVHDPDMVHKEKVRQLKLGGKRKMEYLRFESPISLPEISEEEAEDQMGEPEVLNLEGDVLEVEGGDNDPLDEEDDDGARPAAELLTVQDSEGTKILLLEMIQLDDDEQQATVYEEMTDTKFIHDDSDGQKSTQDHELIERGKSIKIEREVDACFGFDEDDGEEDELPQDLDYEEKVVLRIV